MRQLILSLSVLLFAPLAFSQVKIANNHLVVENQEQPQLFGAELQYFRLRGGYGRNVPRAKVVALWNKALDRMVEAKMNTVSFYIPWDFHEYAEGKFDFDGTVDEDGDGQPDYPSRDLKTFFKLIEAHGIHRIMVRPGPYINAEWGFLGFGAIPEWFHNKYPGSHMMNSSGQRTTLYDYHNPDLLRHTQLWFETLQREVLRSKIGPGKPVIFLQLDNETNFQWQSLYNHDFSPPAVARYQKFLQNRYGNLSAVNQAHGRQWTDWTAIKAPVTPGANNTEDQDWYRFADESIYTYLAKIRKIWQNLGVQEPQVLFTLAESFNATENGLLPNFIYRNAPQTTGMMTVNLYPKTYEDGHALLNNPFKADLDVKSADAASDAYVGSKQEWVLGPEIQGGWWRGINVSPEARQQTYLTVIGHGLKAFYVYYFNEGQNWDVDWIFKKIKPVFEGLRQERHLENARTADLPDDFWGELQARSDREIFANLNTRQIMQSDPDDNKELFFDSPLDGEANPRNHFVQLKMLGEKVLHPHQDFLARALEAQDNVAFVKDSSSHVPNGNNRLPSIPAESDWSAGLLGYLMNADVNPVILHGDLSPEGEFDHKVLIHLDTGISAPRTLDVLKKAWARGQTLVNFLADQVPESVGLSIDQQILSPQLLNQQTAAPLRFFINSKGLLSDGNEPDAVAHEIQDVPLYTYNLKPADHAHCEDLLFWQKQSVAYRCQTEHGTVFQVGANLFKDYNSNAYANLPSLIERRLFLKALLKSARVEPQVELSSEALATVAFARKDPEKKLIWVTVKTGSTTAQNLKLRLSPGFLKNSLRPGKKFQVTDLISGTKWVLNEAELTGPGFKFSLPANGSTVYVVENR